MIAIAIIASASWASSLGSGGGLILIIVVIVASYIFDRQKKGYGTKKAEYD